MQVISYFDPIFCPKFRWLIWCIVSQVYYFLIFHYYIIILILDHHYLHCSLFSGDLSLGISLSSPIFSASFIAVSKMFCGEFLETCNLITNFITNQITSCFCYFLNCSFRSSFKCFCGGLLRMMKTFLMHS